MNRQANALLAVVGGAVMLLGCTQDPVGTAPGGLEPSASSQKSDESSESGEGPGDAN